jgi:hypothetical protein
MYANKANLKNSIWIVLLFRVVEIHRICETTATPSEEGANLSEIRTIRGFDYIF